MSPEDAALLKRWITDRDPDAFEGIVKTYAAMVYATCLRVLGNRERAEDASQDCFVKLIDASPSIHSSLGGWLHRTATRRALDLVRAEQRRARRESAWSEEPQTKVVSEWDDFQQLIDEAIDSLPDDQRDAVVAHFLGQRTHESIAKDAGVTRSAISQRISRGIAQVREQLKQAGVTISGATLMTLVYTKAIEAAPNTLHRKLSKIGIAGGGRAGSPSISAFVYRWETALVAIAVSVLAFIIFQSGLFNNAEVPENVGMNENTTSVDNEIPIVAEFAEEEPEIESGPEEEAHEIVIASQVIESAPEDAEEVEPSLSGRVYDKLTKAPLTGVLVSAISAIRPNRAYTAVTDAAGRYEMNGLPIAYAKIWVEEIEGYPETRKDGTNEVATWKPISASNTEYDFAFSQPGILEGRVRVGGKPLRNEEIRLVGISRRIDENNLIRTDDSGFYRTEFMIGFEGTVQFIKNQNGVSHDLPLIKTKVKLGKTTRVDLDFPAGTASIAGRVYYHEPSGEVRPMRAVASVSYDYQDGDRVNRDYLTRSVIEKDGFLIEGLWSGRVVLTVKPVREGPNQHTGRSARAMDPVVYGRPSVSFDLNDGDRVYKEFHLYPTTIHFLMHGWLYADVWVFAIEGEQTPPEGIGADFRMWIADRQRSSAISSLQILPDEFIHEAYLFGLPPGRYTIVAIKSNATWISKVSNSITEKTYDETGKLITRLSVHSGWTPQFTGKTERAYQVTTRIVHTYVTIPEGESQVEVDLFFPDEEEELALQFQKANSRLK